ncbi:UPF0651 protein P31B10.02, mitochondrial [Linum perenne]
MRNLSLKPIRSPFFSIHHRRIAANELPTVSADPLPPMEAKVEPNPEGSTENFDKNEKEKEEKAVSIPPPPKKPVSIPPPPEKPEPGDCCGSGCVRCVWDVYYDELEDYNKMCETVADASKS